MCLLCKRYMINGYEGEVKHKVLISIEIEVKFWIVKYTQLLIYCVRLYVPQSNWRKEKEKYYTLHSSQYTHLLERQNKQTATTEQQTYWKILLEEYMCKCKLYKNTMEKKPLSAHAIYVWISLLTYTHLTDIRFKKPIQSCA